MLRWFFLLLLVLGCAAALRCEAEQSQLSAFGTLAYSRTNSAAADYRLAPSYQFAAGEQWTSVLDSRLGVHGQLGISDNLRVVGQVLLRRNSNDEVQWTAPWAYLHWQPDPQYELLLGRFRHSLFMITDEIDVGYAWPWSRPPVDLYSLVAESSYVDGVKFRYRDSLGSYTAVMETHFGRLNLNRLPRMYIQNDKNYGLALSLSNGLMTYRVSMVQAQVSLRSERLNSLIQQIALQSPLIAEEYSVTDVSPQRYLNLGVRYESGNWLLISEASRLWLKTRLLPDKWACYLTIGKTLDDWTPYLTFARQNMVEFTAEQRLTGATAAAIRQFEMNAISAQTTYSAGLRWDFAEGVALKIQLDNIRQPAGSGGTQGRLLPPGQTHYLLSTLSLDWVY
jgi:hypothetical protein